MAIFGPFSTVHAQLAHDPRFAAAFSYVREVLQPGSVARRRIESLAVKASDKVELTGGAVAIEQVYHTKPRPEGFFESHRKFIDVQLIVEGEELMAVEDVSRLSVTDAYNSERDLVKYADTTVGSLLNLQAGDAAIFFPADGHMPTLRVSAATLVRKTVVKVPVKL